MKTILIETTQSLSHPQSPACSSKKIYYTLPSKNNKVYQQFLWIQNIMFDYNDCIIRLSSNKLDKPYDPVVIVTAISHK